uniref:Putative calcineurin-like phosphoesterase n=1 Tax=viral metagenome TaxID=1070528 RepID=A0A6M3L0G4_9ZZZZ
MRTIISGDNHIYRDNIEEQKLIFPEIMSYEADRVIFLGDYYDRKLLTSEELVFGTSIMKQFKDKYKEVYVLEGNHDKDTIKYLISLGIDVRDNLVLDNNYYGHFFVEESMKAFNSAKRSLSELEQYDRVFLGHQHSFQILGKHRFHVGSPLWIDFGEVNDVSKSIIILEDDKINIIELKTPIPMIDVFQIKDLGKLDNRNKVRYVIKDFKQLKKEANKLEDYRKKFYSFKIKLDFENKEETLEISPKKDINEIVEEWLKSISDKEVKEELSLTFKENDGN